MLESIFHASKVMIKILQAQASAVHELRISRCTSWVQKRQKNQRSNCRELLITQKAREFQKIIYFYFINYANVFDCAGHNKFRKILKEMGKMDHLTCLLSSLYANQETTIGTGHGITDWFKTGKGVHKGCILSLCLFNLYAEVHHVKHWAG